MRIVVLCEGKSDAALRDGLRDFVHRRLPPGLMRPGIQPMALDGYLTQGKSARQVKRQLSDPGVIGVVALTDVYPKFKDARSAKAEIAKHLGAGVDTTRLRCHAAQYDLEAWLLPFWDEIANKLNVSAKSPGSNPEAVNGQNPPSFRFKALFERVEDKYDKVLDAAKYLTADRIERSYKKCPELKEFLNSLLAFAGAPLLE